MNFIFMMKLDKPASKCNFVPSHDINKESYLSRYGLNKLNMVNNSSNSDNVS